jgi:hypothetical protein
MRIGRVFATVEVGGRHIMPAEKPRRLSLYAAAFAAPRSTMRTMSAMMVFNSKFFGV